MEAVRDSWTDDRMDDLARRVDDGFARVDAEFARVDARFVEVKGEIRDIRIEMNARFDSLQQTMLGGFFVLLATIIASQFA